MRKKSSQAGPKKTAEPVARTSGVKRLRCAAQSTLFVAGMTAARLMAEAEAVELKLFSPGLVDRLQEPISRIHE